MNDNIVLSIDASSQATGWAVLDRKSKNLISYGVVKMSSKEESNKHKRIIFMVKNLEKIVETYNPSHIYAEDVPPALNNSNVVLTLGILQGTLCYMADQRNIPLDFIGVGEWHSSLGFFDGTKEGKKRDALKKKSIEMANERYGLELIYKSPSSKFNEDDISDAINIGRFAIGDYEEIPPKLGRRSK